MKTPAESIQKLLQTEDLQLKELHQIVADTLREEKLISRRLRREFDKKPNFAESIADKVATFGGSWKFIIAFTIIVISWIFINGYYVTTHAFDPYPFILLNLILSCVAALQAPVILMSQNRLEAKDRKRSEHDYLINLKAELEIRALHQKLDMLIMEQMTTLLETQKQQLEYLSEMRKEN